jgi:hypothetical protein
MKNSESDQDEILRSYYIYIKLIVNVDRLLMCESPDKDLIKVLTI